MKKTIPFITAALMLFSAGAGFALEPISEAEMDTVTGRKGVSLAADNSVFYHEVDFWYRDPDGTGDDNGAAVGFYGMQFLNYGRAITWEIGEDDPPEDRELPGFFHFVEDYDYQNRGLEASDVSGTLEDLIGWIDVKDFEARAIFIDIMAEAPEEIPNMSGPVIWINIPTMAMHLTKRKIELGMTASDTPLDAGDSEIRSLGSIEMGPTTNFLMDGDLLISPGGDPSL